MRLAALCLIGALLFPSSLSADVGAGSGAPPSNVEDMWVARFTGLLALIGFLQLIVFGVQAKRLRQTVESDQRTAMPFLFPRVTELDLHPPADEIGEDTTHRPTVRVSFENMGQTPGILFIYERDHLPTLPPAIQHTAIQSDAVVSPGRTGGGRRCSCRDVLGARQLRELAARAGRGEAFRRCYLVGYVIYDDFFDVRHTKRFCLKIRQNGFQAPRGGTRYNGITRRRAPREDLLGTPTEDE